MSVSTIGEALNAHLEGDDLLPLRKRRRHEKAPRMCRLARLTLRVAHRDFQDV